MIRTIYEDGFEWVEFDAEAWANAKQTDYINGIPMLFPRK